MFVNSKTLGVFAPKTSITKGLLKTNEKSETASVFCLFKLIVFIKTSPLDALECPKKIFRFRNLLKFQKISR